MNNIKIIIRKLRSNALYTSITIIGLMTGFVAITFINIWLRDEFNYDTFHKKADRVYRITVEIKNEKIGFHWDFARSYYLWLKNIKEDIAGVESMVRISRWTEGVVKVNDKVWHQEIFYADSTINDLFTLKFIKGNPQTCLSRPGQVILSEKLAESYFGEKDPMGQTIYLYCSRCMEQKPYQVTGIYKDLPSNSHIHFKILASYEDPENIGWGYYYLLLDDKVLPETIINNFRNFAQKYVGNEEELNTIFPQLQKITDIHLKSSKERELEQNGSIKQIKLVSSLAVFILFITLFNFFNLRYVNLIKGYKAIQIFRFAGATQKNIHLYFMLESLFIGILASLFALIILYLVYPYLNLLIGKDIYAGNTIFISTSLVSLFIVLILSVITGSLPYLIFKIFAKYRVRFDNSSTNITKIGGRLRILKLLMGLQYISTFILIISVIVVNGQLKYFMQNSLGNENEKIINIDKIPCQVINKFQIFKEEALKSPYIKDITSSMQSPGTEFQDMSGFETTGLSEENANKLIYVCPVDDNFFSFYDIKIVEGNSFPLFKGNDTIPESFILNRKALEYMGWKEEEAIGKPFRLKNNYTSKIPGKIVGVVENFQPSSMTHEIKPYVFLQKSFWLFSAQVKYDTSNIAESIGAIKKTWASIYPDFPLVMDFVDDLYKDVYINEIQLKNISFILSLIAILLSGIGLFGVTGLVYQTKIKEIGVRKVNGATIKNITYWLLKDNVLIVLISQLFAFPLGYYIMNKWLQNYVYRINLNTWIFIVTGILILSIVLISIGLKTWQTARRNPVEALRYE